MEWCKTYLFLSLPLIAGTIPPGTLGSMKQAIGKSWYPQLNYHLLKVGGFGKTRLKVVPRFTQAKSCLEMYQ